MSDSFVNVYSSKQPALMGFGLYW